LGDSFAACASSTTRQILKSRNRGFDLDAVAIRAKFTDDPVEIHEADLIAQRGAQECPAKK
jgi:hypothetical protein